MEEVEKEEGGEEGTVGECVSVKRARFSQIQRRKRYVCTHVSPRAHSHTTKRACEQLLAAIGTLCGGGNSADDVFCWFSCLWGDGIVSSCFTVHK